LQALLESAVTAIITIDAAGCIEGVNPATERMFGYEAAELMKRNIKLLMPEPYHSEHDRYLADYLTTGIKKIIGIGREVSGRHKDGRTFPIHLAVSEFSAGGSRYFTGIIHDLSDRKHVEEALRESERRLAQSQKMEAVGQLTGGIAHDFKVAFRSGLAFRRGSCSRQGPGFISQGFAFPRMKINEPDRAQRTRKFQPRARPQVLRRCGRRYLRSRRAVLRALPYYRARPINLDRLIGDRSFEQIERALRTRPSGASPRPHLEVAPLKRMSCPLGQEGCH
jgi:PAS domain S-box-containing protein